MATLLINQCLVTNLVSEMLQVWMVVAFWSDRRKRFQDFDARRINTIYHSRLCCVRTSILGMVCVLGRLGRCWLCSQNVEDVSFDGGLCSGLCFRCTFLLPCSTFGRRFGLQIQMLYAFMQIENYLETSMIIQKHISRTTLTTHEIHTSVNIAPRRKNHRRLASRRTP